MRKKWIPALVLMLTMALALQTFAADPIDLTKNCGLTIEASGTAEYSAELAGKVVYDIYKVASAVAVQGYDTYAYQAVADFSSLGITEVEDMEQDDWRALSQEAAKIVLEDNPSLAPTKSTSKDSPKLSELSAGLYLVVARGADTNVNDKAKYTERVNVKDEEGRETGEDQLVTYVNSGQYVYRFLPELVSLPTKEAENGSVNTANSGEWLYNTTITMKPERDTALGSLRIIKNLLNYEDSTPATFVFRVIASMDGKIVYSNTTGITFDSNGTLQSEIFDKIPIGSTVTIEEVYTGSYKLISPTNVPDWAQWVTNRTVHNGYVLKAGWLIEDFQPADVDDVLEVTFTNDYDRYRRTGYGVVNHFEYDGSTWVWTPITK